jgi:hypothetical protein
MTRTWDRDVDVPAAVFGYLAAKHAAEASVIGAAAPAAPSLEEKEALA